MVKGESLQIRIINVTGVPMEIGRESCVARGGNEMVPATRVMTRKD